jgi:hypothetical protein
MVDVLSCIKDWELADQHKQHTVEKETKDLEATFWSYVSRWWATIITWEQEKGSRRSKDEQGGRRKEKAWTSFGFISMYAVL